MKNIIYGLKDPRNDVYYYIGKSSVGNKRALQHLLKSHSEKVNNWVNEIRNNGLNPIVDLIEEVERMNNLIDREKYWVNYYSKNNPEILNTYLIENEHKNKKRINEEKPVRTETDKEKFETLLGIVDQIHIIIKNERIFSDMNQGTLAKKAGIARNTIVNLETGHENQIGLGNIKKILKVLEKSSTSETK